jgi:hypothetical protein
LQSLAIFGNLWQSLAIIGNHWQSLTIFDNLWQSRTKGLSIANINNGLE